MAAKYRCMAAVGCHSEMLAHAKRMESMCSPLLGSLLGRGDESRGVCGFHLVAVYGKGVLLHIVSAEARWPLCGVYHARGVAVEEEPIDLHHGISFLGEYLIRWLACGVWTVVFLPRLAKRTFEPSFVELHLRRLESSNIFRGQQQRSEWTTWLPPNHYAYGEQLSPQMCVITCRWLVWWFAHYYGKVFIIDWDESNAFCNIVRKNMDSLFTSDVLHIEEWAERFFNSFEIYMVSPYGFAGPYIMRHGGSQGDSMGAGLYGTTTCARTKFHQGVLLPQKNRADLSPCAEQHTYKNLAAPWDPSVKV